MVSPWQLLLLTCSFWRCRPARLGGRVNYAAAQVICWCCDAGERGASYRGSDGSPQTQIGCKKGGFFPPEGASLRQSCSFSKVHGKVQPRTCPSNIPSLNPEERFVRGKTAPTAL